MRGSNSDAFGTTAGGVTVTSGAAVELSGTSLAIGAEALSLDGTGVSNGGALRNVSGNNSWAGVITLADVTGIHRINSDAGLLTIGAGGITETGSNNKELTFGGAGNTTVNGIISGANDMGLTKDGVGTLTLNNANTYTRLTTVSGGTLAYGVTNALSSGAVTVNGGILDIKTFNDTVGAVTLTSGSITGTTGVLTGTSYALNGTVNTSVSAILAGAGALTKTGAGTATLTGANSYTGLTDVQVGVLRASNNNAFGTNAGGVDVASGAAVELSGTNLAIGAEVLSLDGTGVSNGGALRNVSGNNSWAGAITLADVTGVHRINSDSGLLTIGAGGIGETGNNNKDLTFGGAGNVTVTGNITANAGDMRLFKDGAGILTLSGSGNTYDGLTTITGGTLAYGASNIIVGGVTVNGGILDIKTFSDTVGAVTLTSGSIAGTTGVLTGSSYALNGTVNTSVSAILGGAVALTKTGAGTATLSGANTYTGTTTITTGKLVVDGSLGGTAVTVNGGAILSGSGTIGTLTAGTVTLNAGANDAARGAINLADGSIGTLSFAAKTAANTTVLTIGGTAGNASILHFDVGATVDQIALGTNARLNIGAGGGLVRLTGLGGLGAGTQNLITASTARTGAGTLTLDATTGNFGGLNITTGFSGNNYQLTATANAAATAAYWKGTNDGVWNSFAGGNTNTSNFASNIGGTNATGKVDATTDVNFNATSSTNFSNTTLGENFTIKTLTFGNSATSSVGIGGTHTLTITPGSSSTGVTVAAGSGNHTISSKVALGLDQTWTVTSAGQTLRATNQISGTTRSLTKAGAGTLSLGGTNTYTGATIIAGGVLALESTGSIDNSSGVTLNSGNFDVSAVSGGYILNNLSGSGSVTGDLTVSNNLSIGSSPGMVTFNGDLTLGVSSVSDFEITSLGLGNYDLAASGIGTQAVSFGGILNLLFTPGFNTTGSVTLFDFENYNGGFSTVNTSGLASGYSATFDSLNGTVVIVPEPSTLLLGSLGVLALLRRRRSA